MHAHCVHLYVYEWSNLNSLWGYGLCCVFTLFMYMEPRCLSLSPFPLSLSLAQSHIQLVAPLFILPPPSAFSLSLYPSICGRDEVTICCSERARKGLRGERERESDRMGESKQCCDIVIAVKVELNWGEQRGDVCSDSVTAVEGKEGLTGTERKTE